MGTNCAPLLADIFQYSYDAEFIQSLLSTGRKRLASQFNFTYLLIDTSMTYYPLITLTLKNISVRCIPLNLRSKTQRRATLLLPTWIYSCQSVGTVNFTLPFTTSVSISIFHITNFPFLSSNIPSSLAYGVFFSQLNRYARASSSYECFILRAVRLSNKLLGQRYVKERLRLSLRKFYGQYGDLIKQYEVPLSRM